MFSRRSTRQILLVSLTAALLLASCNIGGATPAPTLDINAVNTSIVGTTVAQLSGQFTQTALAAPTDTPAPPTDTPASLPTAALPTLDLSAASPTLNAAALPTFSFVNTPVAGGTSATQAPVVLPTSQPAVGGTASLNDACNSLTFEGDATIPDGTIIKPGTNFKKEWSVRNSGTCKWDDGYSLVYIGGSTPNLDPVNFDFKKSSDFVAAGQGINLGINLTTPCTPGKYQGTWRMKSDTGYYFGTPLSVYVEVTEKC